MKSPVFIALGMLALVFVFFIGSGIGYTRGQDDSGIESLKLSTQQLTAIKEAAERKHCDQLVVNLVSDMIEVDNKLLKYHSESRTNRLISFALSWQEGSARREREAAVQSVIDLNP